MNIHIKEEDMDEQVAAENLQKALPALNNESHSEVNDAQDNDTGSTDADTTDTEARRGGDKARRRGHKSRRGGNKVRGRGHKSRRGGNKSRRRATNQEYVPQQDLSKAHSKWRDKDKEQLLAMRNDKKPKSWEYVANKLGRSVTAVQRMHKLLENEQNE